jgi:hypothetical protein
VFKKKKIKTSFCSRICSLSFLKNKKDIILLMENFSFTNLARKMNEVSLLKYFIMKLDEDEIEKFSNLEKKEGLKIIKIEVGEKKFEKQDFEEKIKIFENNSKID